MTKYRIWVVAALVCGSTSPAWGQYTQNFNTLAGTGTSSTVPSGWAFNEAGANANTVYTAGTGSSTTGDTYSFGTAAADRAFGGLLSGNVIPTIGVNLQNLTGSTLSTLDVSYFGEQWRLGTSGRADRLDFQYSLDATSLTTGTWIDVDALDFVAPNSVGTVGALDGNAAGNRTQIIGQITGLSLADGGTIWIRWSDFNASGADDGLGIDDFNITQNLTVPVPEPGSVLALAAGAVGVGRYARRRRARQSSAAE